MLAVLQLYPLWHLHGHMGSRKVCLEEKILRHCTPQAANEQNHLRNIHSISYNCYKITCISLYTFVCFIMRIEIVRRGIVTTIYYMMTHSFSSTFPVGIPKSANVVAFPVGIPKSANVPLALGFAGAGGGPEFCDCCCCCCRCRSDGR